MGLGWSFFLIDLHAIQSTTRRVFLEDKTTQATLFNNNNRLVNPTFQRFATINSTLNRDHLRILGVSIQTNRLPGNRHTTSDLRAHGIKRKVPCQLIRHKGIALMPTVVTDLFAQETTTDTNGYPLGLRTHRTPRLSGRSIPCLSRRYCSVL